MNDTAWLNRLENPKLLSKYLHETIVKWSSRLKDENNNYIDEQGRSIT
jgi:hypothetical protein